MTVRQTAAATPPGTASVITWRSAFASAVRSGHDGPCRAQSRVGPQHRGVCRGLWRGANAFFIASGGGRLLKRTLVAAIFALGATAAAVVVFAGFGAVGLVIPHLALDAAAVAVAASACALALRGGSRFIGDRRSWQANRARALRGPVGVLYFGALLGAGLLTEISTPIYYVALLLAAANGLGWAVIGGIGYGIGRSFPAIAGAGIGMRLTPHIVALWFVGLGERRAVLIGYSAVGVAVAAFSLAHHA